MQIFSTCGTKTCKSLMMVCRGNFCFQAVTQAWVGTQPGPPRTLPPPPADDDVDDPARDNGARSLAVFCWGTTAATPGRAFLPLL